MHQPSSRKCPDCGALFDSVQSTGVCPQCQLIFDVAPNGDLLRRRIRIGESTPPQPSATEQAAHHVRKYLSFLHAAKITANEFNYNLLLYWVDLPNECWIVAASQMPDDIAKQFSQYLDDYLIPREFMPSPTCFMVGPFDAAAIEQKRVELQPRYREIHDFWCRYIDPSAGPLPPT